MRAAILVDTGFGGPPTAEEMERMRAAAIARGESVSQWGRGLSARRVTANRVYPTLEAALARFRFMPPQVPGNLFIADYIARHSLRPAPLPGGDGEGWTWRFDPGLWSKLDRTHMRPAEVGPGTAPMVHVYGDRSAIIQRHSFRAESGALPPGLPSVVIPDSEHHIMVDQPLALVAALRALLVTWL
jgi:pimeloyl-ACP methyl ester carboxylesterase